MFYRQFGRHRPEFFHVLRIIEPVRMVNKAKAVASSGSDIPCELRLGIMLRILRGGSCLEFDWYAVSANHVLGVQDDMA